MLFVIENLEPRLSDWLRIEYSHAAKIAGKSLLITNVKKRSEFREFSKVARVERRRARELFEQRELIVLDPRARKTLSPDDFRGKKAAVIGGILGEEPPLGRTKKLLTRSLPGAIVRNLGKHQFPIDAAVHVVKRVSEGTPFGKVPVQHGVEIQISKGHSVILPYAYPLVDGKPLVSDKIIAHVKRPWPLGMR